MKWIFYVIVFIYMFYRAVYGIKSKEIDGISIETVKYESDKNYLLPGVRKSIYCKAGSKDKPMEWIDPMGRVVKRSPKNRVYVQEYSVLSTMWGSTAKTRVPALMLVFSSLEVDDSGVWVCQGEKMKRNVSLCIINPSRFVDNSTVYEMDTGRSITLTCHAKGEPEPNVVWYRNGEIITDDATSKYQFMTKYNLKDSEGLLTITALEAEDSGVYTCDAVQQSPNLDDCNHIESMNITLLVKYAPEFKDGNETSIVYGIEGESLRLICSANGYPVPTYEWLEDNEETSSKFGQDKIELLNDGAEAVLTLEPKSYTWNQKYRCRAMNTLGDVYKSFLVVKSEKPTKPSYIETLGETGDSIQLEISWYNGITFPVDSIHVQYLKAKSLKDGKPKESDWSRARFAEISPDVDEGLNVILPDLHENTDYYIRLRAVNSVGASQWSKVILASTVESSEIPEELEGLDDSSETTAEPVTSSVSESTFYGIFFAGGMIVIVVAAIFLMRLI